MKKKAGIISIFCLWVCFATDIQGQDCWELNGTETVKWGAYKGTVFPVGGQTFSSLMDCNAKALKLRRDDDAWKIDYACIPCKGWQGGGKTPTASKPNTSATPNASSTPTTPDKAVPQDNSSLCATQRENIDLLKNKQNALGKDDAATYSMLNSAINQMKNVECGITLKNVDCKNKNCSFEWSTKDSHVDDAKAKASVNRFYSEVKKEQKEEADQNAQKAENIKMVIETVVAIAGLIEDYYQPKQSNPRYTKVDDDKDGKTDALVEQTANDGQNLYIDTDDDGVADRIAHIDKTGKATYERLDVSKNPISMNQTSPIDKWEGFHKSQTGKVGDDGYMTIVKPVNKLSEKYDYNATEKTYFINGIENRYDQALESARLLSNAVGQSIIQVYSATATDVFVNDLSQPVNVLSRAVNDLSQAMNYRLNTNAGSPSSDNLAKSLTYDLLSDKKVTLYAHSRGGAEAYQMANNLSEAFNTAGIVNKLQNLTIVTVGGYSPPASSWPKGITIETITHSDDPVPTLGGNGIITEIPSIKYAHSFETYLNEILDYNINRKKKKGR